MRRAKPRAPGARMLWLLTTALQLLQPGAVACADARLDAVETHAVAHVESHTQQSCARLHPPDCALCHFLTAPTLTGRAVPVRFAAAPVSALPRTDRASATHSAARPHPQPRAPPALS